MSDGGKVVSIRGTALTYKRNFSFGADFLEPEISNPINHHILKIAQGTLLQTPLLIITHFWPPSPTINASLPY
jgi:hypothetical protein